MTDADLEALRTVEVADQIYFTAAEMQEVVLTTTDGSPYTRQEACTLAYNVWIRFGRDDRAATEAWRRMLESDASVTDFVQLVRSYMYAYITERKALPEA